MNRELKAPAPNGHRVSDFTSAATWAGFVCVAFVIDAHASRIVGWRASRAAEASVALDALEQALHARGSAKGAGPVHHSGRVVHRLSIRYAERRGEAGVAPSVGGVGDSRDHALRGRTGDDDAGRPDGLGVELRPRLRRDLARTLRRLGERRRRHGDGRHRIGELLWRPTGRHHRSPERVDGRWSVARMVFDMTQEIGHRARATEAMARAAEGR